MPLSASLTIRPPAVAGRFYPGRPGALADEVRRHLDGARAAGERTRRTDDSAAVLPPAIVAPHAGYLYSGPIAGSAFGEWHERGAAPRRVVILGPNHYVPLTGLALPAASAFATPLGALPLAAEIAEALLALPFVRVDAAVHAPEHALEVELPFLQVLFGDVEIVPLLVGEATPEQVAAALEIAWSAADTRVVVSSDLSHYLAYDEARTVDARTAGRICGTRAGERLLPLSPFEACGARSLDGWRLVLQRRGLTVRLLDLRNSGDTAGRRDQVVGYGAFACDEPGSAARDGGGPADVH